jgi:hypothetical protein
MYIFWQDVLQCWTLLTFESGMMASPKQPAVNLKNASSLLWNNMFLQATVPHVLQLDVAMDNLCQWPWVSAAVCVAWWSYHMQDRDPERAGSTTAAVATAELDLRCPICSAQSCCRLQCPAPLMCSAAAAVMLLSPSFLLSVVG